MKETYLTRLRDNEPLSVRQQMAMTLQLSLPAIMAQVSSIIMQYIDASMVGRLGANESASIGLAASSTWLFGGLCNALVTGFTVQVAQQIGAKENGTARNIMKLAFLIAPAFAILLAALGAAISGSLPIWLGGHKDIIADTSSYFLVFALSLPIVQINTISGAMLQASGNMRLPSILHIMMCGLDVIFNLLLIFPSQTIWGVAIPGADLGVMGAALGTALAQAVTACIMAYMLLRNSPILHLRKEERFTFSKLHLKRCIKISIPVAVEQCILSGAQILSTRIVAPLGTIALAANSFAVTAESLCYMPGFGIANAAITLIGQSTGAKRNDLTRQLAFLTTGLGMAVMAVMAVFMYIAAPFMIGMLSPDPAVVALGIEVLRIEAFAEPMYAASIVAASVFRGAGDALTPSLINFSSMWLIRLPLAAFLAPSIGLRGVWIAMCIELCVRGALFLIRLHGRRWQRIAMPPEAKAG